MTFKILNGRPTTDKKVGSVRRYGVRVTPSLAAGEQVTSTEVTAIKGEMAVADKQFSDGVLSAKLGPSAKGGGLVSVKFSWTTNQGNDYEILDFSLSKE